MDEEEDEEEQLKRARLVALEPACAIASSPAARSHKAYLRTLDAEAQVEELALYSEYDLANLTRCALAVGVSANAREEEDSEEEEGEEEEEDERLYPMPMLCIAADAGSARTLKVLLDAGADVKAAVHGWTALHYAASAGQTECVKLLLKARAPLEARTRRASHTPLICAARKGLAEVCALLLKAGACINASNNVSVSAVHSAVYQDDLTLFDILLAGGADVEARNSEGQTVLCAAACDGRTDVISRLLERQADTSALDTDGYSPLLGAILFGESKAVELLLPVSDLSLCQGGRNALHMCIDRENREDANVLFDLVLPYMTNLDAVQEGDGQLNETALHLAVADGMFAMV